MGMEEFRKILAAYASKAANDAENINRHAVDLILEMRKKFGGDEAIRLYRPCFLFGAPKGAQDVVHVNTPWGEYSFYDCGLAGCKAILKAQGGEEEILGNCFYEFQLFRRAVSRVWN